METDTNAQVQDFESLYQNSPCGLLEFVTDGAVITANQTLLNWLGLTEEEITKKAFVDLIDKGGQFYYQLFVQPMLTMQQEVNEINISLKTPSGSMPCLLNASASFTELGSRKIIHAAIFKMGERKKYEVELLNKKTQAEKEKQQKIAALEEVAFDQSHLARVPLANILGLISLVEISNLNEETLKLFNLIEQSALQLDMEIKKIVSKTA
jgi:sigma-B regulation protein RsbU (phosphoserine phosphatase)